MAINWAKKVEDAITTLETKTNRVLKSARALAIIDDVVAGHLDAAELAAVHGVPQAWIKATLGQITAAVGTGHARSLADGSWYEFKSNEQPYEVAAGFAVAWKKARRLP
jgi:hypothetical protein